MAQEPTTGKRKLHSYSLEFKIKAVNFVKAGNSKEETARMYGVDSKRIREWCKQQDKLKDACGAQNAKRCKGRRKFVFVDRGFEKPDTKSYEQDGTIKG